MMGEASQPVGVKKVWLDCDPGMPTERHNTIIKESLVCCNCHANDPLSHLAGHDDALAIVLAGDPPACSGRYLSLLKTWAELQGMKATVS